MRYTLACMLMLSKSPGIYCMQGAIILVLINRNIGVPPVYVVLLCFQPSTTYSRYAKLLLSGSAYHTIFP
jgi:hypothetical protein